MEKEQRRVEILAADDSPQIVSVLSESFRDYPVMRFGLGKGDDYPARLDRLVTFFVMARLLRDDVVMGVRARRGLAAVALVSYPTGAPGPSELDAIREQTWGDLGAAARHRYESYGRAAGGLNVDVGHIHLNMIGVRGAARGEGLGRTLLEAVHALSKATPSSTGVTLSTELESNVRLYEHFGYQVIGSASVESALTTHAMFRRDR